MDSRNRRNNRNWKEDPQPGDLIQVTRERTGETWLRRVVRVEERSTWTQEGNKMLPWVFFTHNLYITEPEHKLNEDHWGEFGCRADRWLKDFEVTALKLARKQ